MTSLLRRAAGAPISWGVCEAPGWGHQLPPARVLAEMRRVGLRATELGPEGYLPVDPGLLADLLATHALELAGGFVPVVLHREEGLDDRLARLTASADLLAAGGASVLVLAADTDHPGYEHPAKLEDAEWTTLVRSIDRVMELAGIRGLTVALHPHHGTAIEAPDHIERLLGSSTVRLCLDTGHVMIGGGDPLHLAKSVPERVAHVHLKDASADLAGRVRNRRIGYRQAVRAGMYRPLGAGDVAVAEIVRALEDSGYEGRYVLEQDTILEDAPDEGAGPMLDAAASLGHLRRVADEIDGRASVEAMGG